MGWRDYRMTHKNKKQDDFRITLLRSDNLAESWQPELHVVFILRGTGKFLHKTAYAVHEGDIFTINGLEGQNLSLEKNAIALCLGISFDFIASVCPDILKYNMNCYSFLYGESQQESFDILRRDLAKAFQTHYKNESRHEIYLKNKVVAILEDMVRYFLDLYELTLEFPFMHDKIAWHCSDIPFFFHNTNRVEICGIPGVSEELEEQIFGAFMAFVRNGRPDHGKLLEWPAVTIEREPTMIFDRKCEVRMNFDDSLHALIDSILPPLNLMELMAEQDIQH